MAASLDEQLFAESQLPQDQDLSGIAALAEQRAQVAERLAYLEDELERGKVLLREYDEVRLPEAMSAIGLSRFSTETGVTVTVEPFVSANIREVDRAAAFDWLTENGHGDLIKHEITASFSRGEDADAAAARKLLESQGYSVRDKSSVHPQTLTAFVKEQLRKASESGAVIDWPEEIRIFQGRRAKIAQPK